MCNNEKTLARGHPDLILNRRHEIMKRCIHRDELMLQNCPKVKLPQQTRSFNHRNPVNVPTPDPPDGAVRNFNHRNPQQVDVPATDPPDDAVSLTQASRSRRQQARVDYKQFFK